MDETKRQLTNKASSCLQGTWWSLGCTKPHGRGVTWLWGFRWEGFGVGLSGALRVEAVSVVMSLFLQVCSLVFAPSLYLIVFLSFIFSALFLVWYIASPNRLLHLFFKSMHRLIKKGWITQVKCKAKGRYKSPTCSNTQSLAAISSPQAI